MVHARYASSFAGVAYATYAPLARASMIWIKMIGQAKFMDWLVAFCRLMYFLYFKLNVVALVRFDYTNNNVVRDVLVCIFAHFRRKNYGILFKTKGALPLTHISYGRFIES
jgi:hypothetical protein